MTETFAIGDRVSYEDVANPRRYGHITGGLGTTYGYERRVTWDDGGETWTDLRQGGWRHEPGQMMHLQGIGKVRAKPAGELRKGDRLTWNYGQTSTVVSVRPVGAQSVEVVEEYGNGKRYNRTFRRTRLVCG